MVQDGGAVSGCGGVDDADFVGRPALSCKIRGTNSLRSGVSVSRQRAGLEFLPHDESIGGRSTSAVGRRADAHLLESRLIEHLQGHGRSDVHRKRPAEPRRGSDKNHRRTTKLDTLRNSVLGPNMCL